MRLPDDFWAVNEDDATATLGGLIAAFFVFALFFGAILSIVVLVWAAQA